MANDDPTRPHRVVAPHEARVVYEISPSQYKSICRLLETTRQNGEAYYSDDGEHPTVAGFIDAAIRHELRNPLY